MGLGYPEDRKFKFSEPFYLHFKYRHINDDHNNICLAVLSIEGSLETQRWAIWVFHYVFAVTELNMYLTMGHFLWSSEAKMQVLEYRRELAWALINNPDGMTAPRYD